MKYPYQWLITKDFVRAGRDVDVYGPNPDRRPHPEAAETFRMYDDAGEPYYEGIIGGVFSGPEPLVDYGAPKAGCSIIRYRETAGGFVERS